MDIEAAAEIFSPDRILIIAIIQFLINKNIIENKNDMNNIEKICNNILNAFKKAKDPVVLIQLEKTELELEFLFKSFRNNP